VWVLTKTEWPALVNLSVIAHVGYRQLTKLEPQTRVIAFVAEEEIVLADCESGEQARAVVRLIADRLAEGKAVLDLSRLRLGASGDSVDEDGLV
jgi:hypothetical protein